MSTNHANIQYKSTRRTKNPAYIHIFRIILIVLGVTYIYPLIFAFQTSFKDMKEFYVSMWSLPDKFNFGNYADAWVAGKIGEYFGNSVIIAIFSLLIIEVCAFMAAYSLSRMHIPHVEAIILFFFVIQMLPSETLVSPVYLMMSRTGIVNMKYVPIFLAYAGWSLPGTITIMKNYLDAAPQDLLEAARIDGANERVIMFKIILPLMRGPILTCTIMNLTYVWGEMMWAKTVTMTTNEGIPLTVGLLNFQGNYGTNWPLLCAAIVIIAFPLYILFLFLQKYFVASLTDGAVKG